MKAIRKAILDRLLADATLTAMATGARIYDTQAPPETALPYLIVQFMGGGVRPITPRRKMDLVFVVKAVSKGPNAAASWDIIDRVDYLLDNHALAVTGYTTYWLKRESPDINYIESAGGDVYRHVGTTFRLRMSKD